MLGAVFLTVEIEFMRKGYWLGLLGLLVSTAALGAGKGNEPVEGINYIPLQPALIVNYGGPGRVRYLKAELSLRAENAADAKLVMHHLPLVRDRLIRILGAQSEETLVSAQGKEQLRALALAEINKAIHLAEYGVEPAPVSSSASTPASAAPAASAAADATSVAAVPVVVLPKPASDLFFNNFVIQK